MTLDHRCSNCFTTYTFNEYMKLEMVWVDENEHKYGKDSLCKTCGKRMHGEKWRLRTEFTLKDNFEKELKVTVSTVDLVISHGQDLATFFDSVSEGKKPDHSHNYWYETMVFFEDHLEKEYECCLQYRYKTQPEAIQGHEDICNALKEGKYQFVYETAEGKQALLIDNFYRTVSPITQLVGVLTETNNATH